MLIVLTNDDGIDAPGIAALEQAVAGRFDYAVVAPRDPMSQVGHRLTTHTPIEVERRDERHFAVHGAPADCARVALRHLFPQATMLLSGINAGGNLGSDIYPSGTVAAAREATLLGTRAIAFSHYKRRAREIPWARATIWTRHVLSALLERTLEPGALWNVNFPHLEPDDPDPEVVECPVCVEPLPVSFRLEGTALHYTGSYPDRERTPGSDVEHCFAGRISLSLLRLHPPG